jgi:hypothetical protein
MADKNHNGSGADIHEGSVPGLVHKAAQLSAHELTDAELAAINKHTLEPLAAEDVFTFKAVLCDNEVDRQFERFNLKALQDLQKLFLGKTVIKDHMHYADNQVARIYSTELDTGTKILKSGEPYTRLIAHCYMVKTASNADLIAEIKAGIKKEGSVGCAVSGAICSICGTDNAKSYCRHWPGKSYDKEGGPQVCLFTLTGAKDAYEFSLVAVPAQRAAGVSKSYTGKTAYDDEPGQTPEESEKSKQADIETLLRIRMSEAQAKHNENK